MQVLFYFVNLWAIEKRREQSEKGSKGKACRVGPQI